MKYIIIPGILLSVFAFTYNNGATNYRFTVNNRDTSKPSKVKKEAIFDYPGYITTDTGRISFLKEFNKGRIIYKQTCAKCHNVNKNGKLYYPDFSLPQLMDYEMRFQYPAHQDELREINLSADELDWVVTFLRFKKLNLPLSAK
jgi:hypothetical protein